LIYTTALGRTWTFKQNISAFFRPSWATESDELLDEGEFQGCGLVRRRFLNMVDNDDFDQTFPRLQLEPELPLHSLENCGAFRRRAFVHVEVQIEVIEYLQGQGWGNSGKDG
jgi:hypothetical protein